jgi:hypothetical protein
LNEKSQAAQPKVTYEYYDEAPTAEQAYEYEADDHTHDNSTEDAISDVVSDAAKVEGDAVKVDDETKSQTPKRSRRQAAPVAPPAAEGADYVYDEAQQAEADPEENVRLLCCSFQRYLVTKDVSRTFILIKKKITKSLPRISVSNHRLRLQFQLSRMNKKVEAETYFGLMN